jgi:WD40 repeat protein
VVWDRKTGARRGQLAGHVSVVQDGDFIEDELFVSVALDHTAILWDVSTGQPLLRLSDVDHLVVTGDRRSVALVGSAGVRVWSPRAPIPELSALPAPRAK